MRKIAFSLSIALSGCMMFSKPFSDRNLGEPLQTFSGRNGSYFPKFLKDFFSGAEQFERQYAALGLARRGIHLIQVKGVNPKQAIGNEANLSWSADGVYLSYEVENVSNKVIFLKNLSGTFSRELFVVPKHQRGILKNFPKLVSLFTYNSGLSWSKDSTRYAFMSNGGAGEYNIFVGGIGHEDEPVVSSRFRDGFAQWNPKENRIAFMSARSGNGDIYEIDLDIKKIFRVTHSETMDLFPEWSPQGELLVFSSGTALRHQIKVIAAGVSEGRWQKSWSVTANNYNNIRPTFSPNGRYISFYGKHLKSKGNGWNIYVVPISVRNISDALLPEFTIAENVQLNWNTGPTWSPNSEKIFYVKNDPAEFNPIYGYDLIHGKTYKLATGTKLNRDIMISSLGVLSFRAQMGAWDKVFIGLTNQGIQLQGRGSSLSQIRYLNHRKKEKSL